MAFSFWHSLLSAREHPHRNKSSDDGGEQRANDEQQLTISPPNLAKSRRLRKNVDNVGRAVCDVGDDRQQEQGKAEVNRKGGPDTGYVRAK